MKIVVPVDSDKKTIVKRTGQAPFFAVFNDTKLEEIIQNEHAAGGHEHDHDDAHHHEGEGNHHRRDIQKFQNCDIILARAVGPQMQSALESVSIKIQKISKYDGDQAQELVAKFLAGGLKSQQEKA
ncbi:MAG: NifB/NifX family molybdenum-iron cluster-binding protein [Sulfurimonas sp.]|jgi:predicted Fe-Mo cluster-binding NifX family protein|nr:NifB/NifX family molybdenum-iron cluster-binding protein [Sulfurimonas sp.]